MANYKAVDSDQLDADLTMVADAIRSKGNTTEKIDFPIGFVSAIDAIKTGGEGDEVVPPTPSDGKTRIYIHLEDGRTSPMLGCCPNGTVTVDWGDGTEPDTLTGISTSAVQWTPAHAYAEPGDYVIALTVDGEMGFYGSGVTYQNSGILRYSSGADPRNYAYQNDVKKVEIGEGVTSMGNSAFIDCTSLASITIPDGVTSIGNYFFYACTSLASITIPDGVTIIGESAFQNCYSLESITIPDGVTSIGAGAFSGCRSLASITIPDGVTSIGSQAFQNCRALANIRILGGVTSIGASAFSGCYGMRYYDFAACTSVPTLSDVSAFSDIPSDCQMLIPAALYDEWSTATNWATYASHMVAV